VGQLHRLGVIPPLPEALQYKLAAFINGPFRYVDQIVATLDVPLSKRLVDTHGLLVALIALGVRTIDLAPRRQNIKAAE